MPIILALPVVTVESRKIDVLKYGTQVTLKCKISSESNIKSVKWLKDEQHIPSEIFEIDKETDDSPHILSFKEIKESNIYEYIFVSHNAKESNTSEPIHRVYGK